MTRNQIELAKANEIMRNNLATETETRRANMAKEAETHRANLVNEWQRYKEYAQQGKIAEDKLLQQQREHRIDSAIRQRQASTASYQADIQRMLADETQRSNRAKEEQNLRDLMAKVSYNTASLDEARKSRVQSQYLTQRQQDLQRDYNMKYLTELRTSNQAKVREQQRATTYSLVGNLANALTRLVGSGFNAVNKATR